MDRWDPSIPRLTEWVAVFQVAATPAQLDEDAAALLRQTHHGMIGRVDVHEGLAQRLEVPAGTWIIAFAAATRAELEGALTSAFNGLRVTPLVVGEFRVRRLAG